MTKKKKKKKRDGEYSKLNDGYSKKKKGGAQN
jgi:hypothetical protein